MEGEEGVRESEGCLSQWKGNWPAFWIYRANGCTVRNYEGAVWPLTWSEYSSFFTCTQPPIKRRVPLSIACVQMKKNMEQEQKMLQESLILGRFGGKVCGGSRRTVEKHKSGNGVRKSTEGYF